MLSDGGPGHAVAEGFYGAELHRTHIAGAELHRTHIESGTRNSIYIKLI